MRLPVHTRTRIRTPIRTRMMLRAVPRILALVAVPAMLANPAWAASYTASTHASSGTVNASGPSDENTLTQGSPVTVSSSSVVTEILPSGDSGGVGNGGSSSYAGVGSGAIHLLASSYGNFLSTNGGAAIGDGTSSSYGYFSETFVIGATCALCTSGSIGTLTFSVGVSGKASGGGDYVTSTPEGGNGGWRGSASWDFAGSVGAGYVDGSTIATSADFSRTAGFSESERGVDYDYTTGGGAGTQTYSIEFAFGQAIDVQMMGHAYSNATAKFDYYASQNMNGGSHGSSAFAADLSHTMGWGGIHEVRDAHGDLVTGFSALGDGGTDFRFNQVSAVPEPTESALLLFGMGALVVFMRRRGGRGAPTGPAPGVSSGCPRSRS